MGKDRASTRTHAKENAEILGLPAKANIAGETKGPKRSDANLTTCNSASSAV